MRERDRQTDTDRHTDKHRHRQIRAKRISFRIERDKAKLRKRSEKSTFFVCKVIQAYF